MVLAILFKSSIGIGIGNTVCQSIVIGILTIVNIPDNCSTLVSKNSSDNLHCYLPDNHYSLDVVYW